MSAGTVITANSAETGEAKIMGDTPAAGSTIATTTLGDIEYVDRGDGQPVLFVHGSPGGYDQGELMTGFLTDAGFRTISLSRPGYLATPLTDDVATPDQQADLAAALMDSLAVDRFAVMCWSGGGPLAYRLAAKHPDQVTALVACAAVSKAYTFERPAEAGMLMSRFGKWALGEMARHAPDSVLKMMTTEEGDLTKEQAKTLIEHLQHEPAKEAFVLGLVDTVAGKERKPGLHNDEQQFPLIGDLGLTDVHAPVLLVHAVTDSDVPFEQSENALAALPNAGIIRVEPGTHLSVWTDPTSDDIQARIVAHLWPT